MDDAKLKSYRDSEFVTFLHPEGTKVVFIVVLVSLDGIGMIVEGHICGSGQSVSAR